jgi:hypothetical protein
MIWMALEAIGTLLAVIVAVLAVIVALFGEWLRTRLLHRYPDLTILPIESGPPDFVKIPTTIQEPLSGKVIATADTYYLRMRVKNKGKVRAEQVEVFAAKLLKKRSDGRFTEVPDFLPMTLRWAHRGPVLPGLSPDTYRYCAVAAIFDPKNRSEFPAQARQWPRVSPESTLLSIMLRSKTNDKGYLQPPGVYRLELQLTAANARLQPRVLEITLTGDWYDDEQEMLSKRKGVGMHLLQ